MKVSEWGELLARGIRIIMIIEHTPHTQPMLEQRTR